jgi:transposase
MSRKKREHSAAFKAKVAIAAIKEELTQNQITSKYSIHTTQIRNWKDQAITAIQECFTKKRQRDEQHQEALITSLYEQIGRLQIQLNWIKKKGGFDHE